MRQQAFAHRGASGYAPELTLAAFKLALDMNCDGVEMDVQMLADGTLIVFHDPEVSRTTNGTGRISEHTLASIKQLDTGSWFNQAYPEKARPEYAGLQVPTLQEVFDLLKDRALELLIEIKSPELYPANFVEKLHTLVCENQLENRVRFLSFHIPSLQKIKEINPCMHTTLLAYKTDPDPVETAQQANANELGILHKIVTPAMIDSAHNCNLVFSVWTVDQPEDMQRMIDLGVDCITSNYPDRLLRIVEKQPHRLCQ
jgi:glycerophosphoryl diester phosphodiesterase